MLEAVREAWLGGAPMNSIRCCKSFADVQGIILKKKNSLILSVKTKF